YVFAIEEVRGVQGGEGLWETGGIGYAGAEAGGSALLLFECGAMAAGKFFIGGEGRDSEGATKNRAGEVFSAAAGFSDFARGAGIFEDGLDEIERLVLFLFAVNGVSDQADVRGAGTAEEDYGDDEAEGDQGEEHEAL